MDTRTEDKKTPLIVMCEQGNAKQVKQLLDEGGKEFTPYDLALIKGYQEAADFLKQKGGLSFSNVSNVKTKESSSTKSLKSDSVKPAKEEYSLLQKDTSDNNNKSSLQSAEQEDILVKEVDPPTSDSIISAEKCEVVDSKKTEIKPAEGTSPEGTIISPVNIKEILKQKSSRKKSESPKLDQGTELVKLSTEVKTDLANEQFVQKSSEDSFLQKEDGIRTSTESLWSEELFESLNPETKDAVAQKTGPIETDKEDTSSSSMGQAQRKEKPKGQYVSLDIVEPKPAKMANDEQVPQEVVAEFLKQKGWKARFSNTDTDHSGIATDPSHAHSRPKSRGHRSSLDQVRTSVQNYEQKRNISRSLQQLRYAQIHMGPMHDIIMFSKMMENYRQGVNGEEMDAHNYTNWDSYLNDQLRFISHIYIDDNQSPREIQEIAKAHHKLLQTEANNHKNDTDKRCASQKQHQEFQRKKNSDLDKEIDKIATRTASLFDNVKSGASTSVESARTHNLRLHEEMKQAREERLGNTQDSKEREMLERQQMVEQIAEQQQEMNQERKECLKKWHRQKDDEMRHKLFQAYRPYFPNDVFNKKPVCISGGRIKSASRLQVEPIPSPRPQRTLLSSRPVSHKSDANFSVAQYRLKDDKVHVQMTPYGLRRVKNQERSTYEDVEDELADAIFFSPTCCTKSADITANWSRKYDGSIRPRTSLVFVEPHIYNDLMKDEKATKHRISSTVQHQHMANGTIQHSNILTTNDSDSLVL